MRMGWMIAVLLLAGCAAVVRYPWLDPAYPRLEPAPVKVDDFKALHAFNERWPARFKSVQTVAIDFGVTTRTLVGYLVVDGLERFRLQGMSEQGVRLFDIVRADDETHVVFGSDEFDDGVLESIARDIRRVFFERLDAGTLERDERGAILTGQAGEKAAQVRLVGPEARVDWYSVTERTHLLYRVDHYAWGDFDGHYLPSVVQLFERGAPRPRYTLTIRMTELEVREQPWPGHIFEAE